MGKVTSLPGKFVKVFGGGDTVLLQKTVCAILIVGNKMEEF